MAKIVEETESENPQPKEIKRTKAEMAFQKMKEKTVIFKVYLIKLFFQKYLFMITFY